MRFKCEQQVMNKALNIVSKAVSTRTTIPTLKGILLEIKEEGILTMTASDMDLSIEEKINVETEESGAVIVPAKLFGDVIRKLPSGEVEIKVDEEKINIKCMNAEFSIVGMPADEFPNIKNIDEESREIAFDKEMLVNMIKKTSFAASIDQTKGIVTGVLIDIKPDYMNMVAIDGYRMAIVKEDIVSVKDDKIIISGRIMNEISKILAETGYENNDIKMVVTDKNAAIYVDNVKIMTRLMVGEFIRYQDILPKESRLAVTVNRADLTESIERASLLSKEGKNNLIKLSVRDRILTITSHSEEGNVKEDVLVNKEGDDIDIGFNSKYLLDILRAVDDDVIKIYFKDSVSPCLVCPEEGDAYKYLLLPVRISNY